MRLGLVNMFGYHSLIAIRLCRTGVIIRSKSNKQVNKILGGCSKLTQKLDFQAIAKKMAEFLLPAFSPVDFQ